MPVSVSAVRDGLKVRFETISGLRAYDTVPGAVVVPAVVIVLKAIMFDATMGRGSDDLVFAAQVLASAASDKHGQDRLDAFLAGDGALSVKAAVEADASLGGIVSFARVAGADSYGFAEYAAVEFYAVTFRIEVST